MKTALVIDDNRQTANTLCRMLALYGMIGRPAYGARAGMLTLRESTPDVIFLDLAMPGVDGFEILAYLRREPRLSGIPVIVVTADDSPETARRARQDGAVDVLLKPVTVESLEGSLTAAGLVG